MKIRVKDSSSCVDISLEREIEKGDLIFMSEILMAFTKTTDRYFEVSFENVEEEIAVRAIVAEEVKRVLEATPEMLLLYDLDEIDRLIINMAYLDEVGNLSIEGLPGGIGLPGGEEEEE